MVTARMITNGSDAQNGSSGAKAGDPGDVRTPTVYAPTA
jgi:hypothetical protein